MSVFLEILKLKSFNEVGINAGLEDDGISFNITDSRSAHGRRIKVMKSGHQGITVPVYDYSDPSKTKTFDELMKDKNVNGDKETDKYLAYTVGFAILNHDKIIDYSKSVEAGNMNKAKVLRSELDQAAAEYGKEIGKKMKTSDIKKKCDEYTGPIIANAKASDSNKKKKK